MGIDTVYTLPLQNTSAGAHFSKTFSLVIFRKIEYNKVMNCEFRPLLRQVALPGKEGTVNEKMLGKYQLNQ